MRIGDIVDRVGREQIDGVIVGVVFDSGNLGPGSVVAVQIGDATRTVFASACRVAPSPTMTDLMVPPESLDAYLAANPPDIVAIPCDGATMPSGHGPDPTVDHHN